jgi:hypothetical protein
MRFRHGLLFCALLLLAVCPRATPVGLGMVTGRIYDEMYNSTFVLDTLHNAWTPYIRIEFEEYGASYTSPTVYDKILSDARARGIKVLGVLTSNSTQDKTNAPWTEAFIQNYYADAKWHMSRYPYVTDWEIWNEPEHYGFGTSHLDGYGLLLKRVFEWARADRQNGTIPAATKICSAGLINQDVNVMRGIYDSAPVNDFRRANGGDIPCDIFAYHPYGQGLATGDPYSTDFNWGNTFEQSFNQFQNFTTVNYQPSVKLVPDAKPVWFTEFGFDSAVVGAENQRVYLEHMVVVMKKYPRIQQAFLYNFHDDAQTYGIFDANLNRKRSFWAYVAHVNNVGLYTPDGVLGNEWPADEVINAYFAQGRGTVGYPYRDPAAPEWHVKVHNWADGKVQNFNGGATGAESGILVSPRKPGVAYWVHAGFWATYKGLGGPNGQLQFPISNEYAYNTGTREDFEGGYMTWDSTNNVRVFYTINNPGFEAGSFSSWSIGGVVSPLISTSRMKSGAYSSLLGRGSGTDPNGDCWVYQTIRVPNENNTRVQLSFWYWPFTQDSVTADWQECQIRNTSGSVLAQVMKVADNAQVWKNKTFDLTPYRGQSVRLYFNVRGNGNGKRTYMYLDDVRVIAD